MEYVDGVSLAELLARLQQAGRVMPPALACLLGAAVARALGYAHAATDDGGQPLHLVHRDVNPSNVMVTRAGAVKLLDFGIASAARAVRGRGTGTGFIKGTMGYLSPEQARGQPLDGRSDLFALGLVLYECLTGRRLFDSADPLHDLRLLGDSEFTPPSLVEHGLDSELDAIVARLLARRPEDRYPTGDDAAGALEAVARRLEGDAAGLAALVAELPASAAPLTGGATRALAAARRPGRRFWIATAGALTGAALATAGWLAWSASHREAAAPAAAVGRGAAAAPPILAVLGFTNLTGAADAAWLGSTLAEIVPFELLESARLRRLPDADVARARRDLGPAAASEELAPAALARLRRALNVDLVLVGGFRRTHPGQVEMAVRLQETAGGRTVARVRWTGDERGVAAAAARAGRELGRQLGGAAPPARPANGEASRLYLEGMERLRQGDPARATTLLEQAAAADPQQASTHLALSQAAAQLGYEARARDHAARASRLAASVSLEQGLRVEAQVHRVHQRWPDAVAAYEALARSFPDDLDDGLALAEALAAAGRVQEARATLERLRALPPPRGDDPRVALAIAARADDGQKRLAAASAARAQALARAAPLLVAAAELSQAQALRSLAQCPRALSLASASRAAFERAGLAREAVMAGNLIAACRYDAGDVAGALRMTEGNVPISLGMGDRRGAALLLKNAGIAFLELRRTAEARARLARSLVLAREIDDPHAVGEALFHLGLAHAEAGDLPGANRFLGRALANAREHRGQRLDARLMAAADHLFLTGAIDQAIQLNNEAVAMARHLKKQETLAIGLRIDFSYRRERGEREAARRSIAELRALAPRLSPGMAMAAAADISDGILALDEGDAATAESLARRALAGLGPGPMRAVTAFQARQLLTLALVARGDHAGASREVTETMAAMRVSPLSPWHRFQLEVNRARVEAASGKVAVARRRLATVGAACRRGRFRLHELRARLAALEIGPRSPTRARRLRALAADRGLVLVATRAASLGGIHRLGESVR